MTEEQKEILIAKMLDAPSSLSDEELNSILHDGELRDIYEASAALSNACIRQPELDIKSEWNNFRWHIRRKPTMIRWVMCVAAIFLGVTFPSSIAVRIIDKVFTNDQQSAIAQAEQSSKANNAPVGLQNTQVAEEKKEEASQEPTTARIDAVANNHHLAQTEIQQSKTTIAQVDTDIDIDIDEYLRVQQARIDNDLALQVAESYIEEYNDLAVIFDATGTTNPALDKMIRKATME